MFPPSTGLEEVVIGSTNAHDQGMLLHIFIIFKAVLRCLQDIMPKEGQMGVRDTVPNPVHEDTFFSTAVQYLFSISTLAWSKMTQPGSSMNIPGPNHVG